jgi:hypothetical protein
MFGKRLIEVTAIFIFLLLAYCWLMGDPFADVNAQINTALYPPYPSYPLYKSHLPIVEAYPSNAFTVTGVKMSIDTSVISIGCPPGHVFTFMANITVNNAGTVKYHWEFSDGRKGSIESLTYGGADAQTVTTTWEIKEKQTANPFSGWARIYIDEPNRKAFSQQPFAITCTP